MGVKRSMRCIALLIALLPSSALAAPASQPSLQQKCLARLADWRARFDQERLSYLISPPYVIAGDSSPARLAEYRDRTILAATRALQATFFHARPLEPILILLFESSEPYTRLARQWFGDRDVSPYGYFRRDNIMVMNVGTGTGTLVHELTHALIKPDFPDVPDWFNEGLGSLYEQCALDADTIRGLPNWRLPALQRAIRHGELRSLKELISDPHFYADENVGPNYAQARYLLLYLQEKGQLAAFYTHLRADHQDDPTGLECLKKLIAPQPLDLFEKQWRAWVLKLRFP
jgi:hypothetical protein